MAETLQELEAKAQALQEKLDTIDKQQHPYHYNDTLAAWHKVLRKIKMAKRRR